MLIRQVESLSVAVLPMAIFLAGLGSSPSAAADPESTSDSSAPDEALLLFLAEAIEVDGEWIDPIVLLEQQSPGASERAADPVSGGQADE